MLNLTGCDAVLENLKEATLDGILKKIKLVK